MTILPTSLRHRPIIWFSGYWRVCTHVSFLLSTRPCSLQELLYRVAFYICWQSSLLLTGLLWTIWNSLYLPTRFEPNVLISNHFQLTNTVYDAKYQKIGFRPGKMNESATTAFDETASTEVTQCVGKGPQSLCMRYTGKHPGRTSLGGRLFLRPLPCVWNQDNPPEIISINEISPASMKESGEFSDSDITFSPHCQTDPGAILWKWFCQRSALQPHSR